MSEGLTIWAVIGMIWAVVLLIELAVVLIWTRGATRWWAGGAVAGLFIVQVLLPPLLGGLVGGLVQQLLNLGSLLLLAMAVSSTRPAEPH